jgi:hypothetical protein
VVPGGGNALTDGDLVAIRLALKQTTTTEIGSLWRPRRRGEDGCMTHPVLVKTVIIYDLSRGSSVVGVSLGDHTDA